MSTKEQVRARGGEKAWPPAASKSRWAPLGHPAATVFLGDLLAVFRSAGRQLTDSWLGRAGSGPSTSTRYWMRQRSAPSP